MKLWAYFKLARRVGRDDIHGIEALCYSALAADGDDFMALMTLANTYWRDDQPIKALEFALRVLAGDPDNVEALKIAASVYAAQNNVDHTYEYAKRFLCATPTNYPPTGQINALLWPLGWIPKIAKLKHKIAEGSQREIDSDEEYRSWAISYVEWVEAEREAVQATQKALQ